MSAELKPVRAVARTYPAAAISADQFAWGLVRDRRDAAALDLLAEADHLAAHDGDWIAASAGGLLERADLQLQGTAGAAPLDEAILRVELPLALAATTRDFAHRGALLDQASAAWSAQVLEFTDDQGLPPHALWELRTALLGGWTRCLVRAETLGARLGDDAARQRFALCVRQALRYARATGDSILGDLAPPGMLLDLLRTAVRLCADEATQDLARQARIVRGSAPQKTSAKRSAKPGPKAAPAEAAEPDPRLLPSNLSEPAGAAILRGDWSPRSPRLAVQFGGAALQWELESAGQMLFHGPAEPEVRIDGRRLEAAGPWSQTCWIIEPGGDYLELERPLAGGWCVQRQMLLLRATRALYLADAILGPAEATVEYAARYPLGPAMSHHPYPSTREGELQHAGRPLARLLPLALPEWLSAPAAGRMTVAEASLHLTHQGRTQRLYAPLFVDLDPRRLKKPATWRQLTIGEKLHIVSPQVAVGYRVQAGRDQWLFYRALGEKGNRTLLGVNLTSEFLAAKFSTAGQAETIVEVE